MMYRIIVDYTLTFARSWFSGTDAQISALCSLAKSYAVLAMDFITAGYPELEDAWRCVFGSFCRERSVMGVLTAKMVGFGIIDCWLRAPRYRHDAQNQSAPLQLHRRAV